jgi:hypothetical protein
MRNKLTKFALSILTVVFVLTGCNKNEDDLAITIKKKQDILTFKSVEEFDSTVQKVNVMKVEERSAWEKTNGFKSFGTICDEKYEIAKNINFKSLDESLAYIATQSDYIQVIDHANGDKCCVTKDFLNPARYIMNASQMYIVGTKAYKNIENNNVSTDIANIETLKLIKNIKDLKSYPFLIKGTQSKTPIQKITNANVGNSFFDWDTRTTYATFRIEIYLDTKVGSDGGNTVRNTSCVIKNYKQKALGIFWTIDRVTTFDVKLTSSDNYDRVTQNNCSGNKIVFSTYSAPWPLYVIAGGPVDEAPYFTKVIYSASNDETCSVSHTY